MKVSDLNNLEGEHEYLICILHSTYLFYYFYVIHINKYFGLFDFYMCLCVCLCHQ